MDGWMTGRPLVVVQTGLIWRGPSVMFDDRGLEVGSLVYQRLRIVLDSQGRSLERAAEREPVPPAPPRLPLSHAD